MNLHVITPVKNSIDTTLQAIEKIFLSDATVDFTFTVYNDFSDEDVTRKLQDITKTHGFNLINLCDITNHPSPNYLLILQLAQQKAIKEKAHLLIVESDVLVENNTIQRLFDYASQLDNPGLIASVTVDEKGEVNFPYLFARPYKKGVFSTSKRLSFCCTLLTNEFLSTYDFEELDPQKSWYDVFISHKSTALGFSNYLITSLPVVHKPHSSRPWKKLKYTNPIKYYWRKYTRGLDKI